MAFAFLFHSMDYEVSILARMREEYDRTGSTELALLASDPGPAPEVSDVAARALADEVVLVTYLAKHAADEGTTSLRSSLWVKADDAWKVLFHQGTPVSPSALDG